MEKALKPTKLQIQKFLETFHTLSEYEGEQRLIRGYGAFKEDEVVELSKEIAPVLEWLRNLP